ncbi:MAG: FHA domain-containing protein [Myxococcota bacterium]
MNDNAPDRVVCEMCGYPLSSATKRATQFEGSAVPAGGQAPSQKRHTQYEPGPARPPPTAALPPPPPVNQAAAPSSNPTAAPPLSSGQKRHTEYAPPPGLPSPSEPDFFAAPLPPRPPINNGDDPFGQAVRPRPAPPNAAPHASPPPAPPRKHGTIIESTGPAAASPQIRGVLIEHRGPSDPGRVHPLRAGRNKIGRGPECDVSVDDGRVSGDHGFLFIKPDRATFIDHSTNGSVLDGQAIHGEQVDVRHGSVLQLGGSRLVLLLIPNGT